MPVSIRRAGPNDAVPQSRDELSATPGGQNLFGTTPGGSRIVYSREQLLSLASSPLSQTPPRHLPLSAIPAEISRSPEKSQVGLSSFTNGGQTGLGSNGPGFGGGDQGSGATTAAISSSFGRSPEKASLRGLAAGNRAFGATPGTATSTTEQQFPNGSSRSPGTAFNFGSKASPTTGSGSVGAVQQSGSFREKLAMQSSPTGSKATVEGIDGDRQVQPPRRDSGPGPASGSLAGGTATATEEQFDMEM